MGSTRPSPAERLPPAQFQTSTSRQAESTFRSYSAGKRQSGVAWRSAQHTRRILDPFAPSGTIQAPCARRLALNSTPPAQLLHTSPFIIDFSMANTVPPHLPLPSPCSPRRRRPPDRRATLQEVRHGRRLCDLRNPAPAGDCLPRADVHRVAALSRESHSGRGDPAQRARTFLRSWAGIAGGRPDPGPAQFSSRCWPVDRLAADRRWAEAGLDRRC